MALQNKEFPLEMQKLTEEEAAEASKDILGGKGYIKYFFRVGPKGYFYTDSYEDLLPKIRNMELRPDDVFVTSFPKSGSNWVQELVWLIGNDFDYATAKSISLSERFPFLEYSTYYHNSVAKELMRKACEEDPTRVEMAAKLKMLTDDGPDLAAKMRSPRFLKTHEPFSILHPDFIEKTKVVYIARDPRDVAVSYFYNEKAMVVNGYKGEFKDFWELFKKNMVIFAPYFSHFREAWELKDHPNMLFLFYEELSKDMPDAIHRVAKFLGKTVSEEQMTELSEHLKFESFRNNKMLNRHTFKELGLFAKDGHFIRKGKVGGWRDYFDEDMAKEAKRWMEDGLQGIDDFQRIPWSL